MSAKPGSASCRPDTLTQTHVSHSAARRAASRRTKRPSGTIRPVSSATATNSGGSTSQRQSASNAVISLPAVRTIGWKSTCSVSRSIARRRSVSRSSRASTWRCMWASNTA